MLGGPKKKKKKKRAIETHFPPEFKWIFYDFNNNRNNTQKTIASNDCVCEFISEPWEWLHEASSRVSDRIYICNRRRKNEKIK